ncbi:MAG TPA: hypothetical protein VKF37_02370, partial [Chloroflexota bacterium]|nr:hypothetical protein [Chloroflexota bacterium]
ARRCKASFRSSTSRASSVRGLGHSGRRPRHRRVCASRYAARCCAVLGPGPMDALAFTTGALVTGGVGILLSLAPCTDLSCVFDQ